MPFVSMIGSEELSFADRWGTSGITTLIGLGMTFAILALLIGTIFLLRVILKELEKLIPRLKKSKKSTEEAAPKSKEKEVVPANEEKPIDEDTLDAIRSAVMNYTKKDDNVVIIKSISRASGVAVETAMETESATKTAPAPTQSSSEKGKTVNAPMPGTILKITVANGKQVKEGDVIFVLEAMKMENDIVSPASGVFTATVSEGAKVNTGDLIAEIQ